MPPLRRALAATASGLLLGLAGSPSSSAGGSRKLLFVSDHLVASSSNVEWAIHSPTPAGATPAVTATEAWEAGYAKKKEALAVLDAHDVDMVLMDLHMPEMDGIEATKRIREGQERHADVPIVCLTADRSW